LGKAYRTLSNEAICVVTGMMPIDIKIEALQLHQQTKDMANKNTNFDKDMEARNWKNPAEASIGNTDENEETGTLYIFTDGSK